MRFKKGQNWTIRHYMPFLWDNPLGFTLIEALIAILILSIMLMGLIPAFVRMYKINHDIEIREAARDLAYSTLEEIRSTASGSIASNSTSVIRYVKNVPVFFGLNVTASNLYNGEIVRVDVRVYYWSSDGTIRPFNATALVGGNVQF